MKFWIFTIFSLYSSHIIAQAFPDRHSTNLTDSWHSCQTAANPNPVRGNTHWIMYNLGDTYSLNKSTIWNFNVPERVNSFDNQAWSLSRLPGSTEDGMKDIVIDISMNGTTWTEWGRFTVPKANASGFYQGTPGPDFQGKIARYILITGITNHGGSCFGISEIKFNGTVVTINPTKDLMEEVAISASPNPFSQQTIVTFSGLTPGDIRAELSDITGRLVKSFVFNIKNTSEEIIINRDGLPAGIYTFTIIKNESLKSIKLQIQ